MQRAALEQYGWKPGAVLTILSGIHYEDGTAIRSAATQNNITMLTSLDTVRVLLDVLEEVTIGVSAMDDE